MPIVPATPAVSLAELRWRATLTQQDLARRAGLALQTISAAERGVVVPRARTRRLIAEALGTSPSVVWPRPLVLDKLG